LRDRTTGPVVIVGHSYGGAVITNATASDPDVKALVYIDAFVPNESEDTVHLASEKPGSDFADDPATVFGFVGYPGAPEGDADLYVKQEVFPHAFANDLPPESAAVLAASQRPLTPSAAAEPSGPPAWKTLPAGPRRHDRQRHPARSAARHGAARWRHDRRGRGWASVHDLPSRCGDGSHQDSSQQRQLRHVYLRPEEDHDRQHPRHDGVGGVGLDPWLADPL
jgi:pimeloyl-ACP methyl ester carboxylesterase